MFFFVALADYWDSVLLITNVAASPKINDDIEDPRCTCEEALDLASLTTDWARETLREAAVPSPPPPYFRLMYLDDMNLEHNKKLAKQKVFKRTYDSKQMADEIHPSPDL